DVAIIISQLRHLLFFFCSRRRHTRFSRDWSSDVCSSDLEVLRRFVDWIAGYTVSPAGSVLRLAIRAPGALEPARMRTAYVLAERSEERRVGKECSTRWGAELGREKQGRTQKG